MYLVNVATKKLESFSADNIPPYAILSHTWGNDDEELSFRDIIDGLLKPGTLGVFKLDGCCKQAQLHGLGYVWIDTCCINKTDHVELSEAINSMFKWYRDAVICYVYLADATPNTRLSNSRWFRRGWTLQELLAPQELSLYGSDWTFLGSREDLAVSIEHATGIPEGFLYGDGDFYRASVAQRFSWASKRTTKRKEDMAYCLLGLFDVSLPIIYGDDHAFARLQREIMLKLRDDSIFAWGLSYEHPTKEQSQDTIRASAGALAESPKDYEYCGAIVSHASHSSPSNKFVIESGFLCITTTIYTAQEGGTYGLLNCGTKDHTSEHVVGIPLQHSTSGDYYFRPHSYSARIFPKQTTDSRSVSQSIHIQMFRDQEISRLSKPSWSIRLRTSGCLLKVLEVYPPGRLHDKLIHVDPDFDSADAVDRTWVRLQRHGNESHLLPDFILILTITRHPEDVQGRLTCALAICSCFTTLKEIADNAQLLWKSIFIRKQASNLSQHIGAALWRSSDSLSGHPRISVVMSEIVSPPDTTIDLTQQLSRVRLPDRFLSALEHEDCLNQRLARKGNELEVREKQLNKTRDMLTELNKQIEKLEASKKSLNAEDHISAIEVERLKSEKSKLESKRFKVSLNRTYLEGCLDEHHDGRNEWLRKIRLRIEKGDVTAGNDSFLDHRLENLVRLLISVERSAPLPSTKYNPPQDMTPLAYAIQEGCYELLQRLLDQGADVNEIYSNGRTALLAAIIWDKDMVVQELLEHGAIVWPALLWSVQNCDRADTLSPLLKLEETALEVDAGRFRMLLLLAAEQGSKEIILELLSWGEGRHTFDLSIKSNQDVVWAAAVKNHDSTVRTLIKHDCSPNPLSCQRLLLRSVLENCASLPPVLWEKKKADIHAKYMGGRNLLWLAADRGYDSVIGSLALIQTVIDPGSMGRQMTTADDFGQNALSRAAENGHVNAAVRLLLWEDPTVRDHDGHTALWYAVINGHADVLQALMKHKSIREDLWEMGKLLWWAVETDQEQMVDVILANDGALAFQHHYHDPHALLWSALGEGTTRIVGKLLAYREFQVHSVEMLQYAEKHRYDDLAKLLSNPLTFALQGRMVVVDRVKPETGDKKQVRFGYHDGISKFGGSMVPVETLREVEDEI
ncbi:hypothetical protein QC761_500550 [Podospora bellae-mahoneyi]|uniref:Heterokaryon incompatibility domain-containing protein n=1 Tax=Podospora bellae-mahoneyi TaxID=2093777 RepID=A0ABR0FC87_9PEZI|nr:hypothetical protein QC761_500550 [Podospora bellae-mahoneyi]